MLIEQERNEGMNVYIVVEGEKTEMTVYPAWLSIIAPNMERVLDARAINDDSYYLFCGYGIPQIYNHVNNAVRDINEINSKGNNTYDYLMVCLDTENESREDIENHLKKHMTNAGISPQGFQIVIFEHKVCLETWFMGNRRIFKDNPNNKEMIEYLHHFNVKHNNPENMESINSERWNAAQFHLKYLKAMLAERNLKYDKNNTDVVCNKDYIEELINRYKETSHISTFGAWYEFVKSNMTKK